MVKLWNLTELERKYSEPDSNPEPYLTLRGHTGPLLAIEGVSSSRDQSKNQNIVFTAGVEGSIHVWNIPQISDVNVYGDTKDGENFCVEVWSDESPEAIWSLKYHPFQDLLLSINACSQIVVWDCGNIDKTSSCEKTGKVKKRFELAAIEGKKLDPPTCCSWLPTH